MSQKGNKCPGIRQYNSFESGFCLNKCERQCVPASVLVQIENNVRTDRHVGKYLSVTSLLGYPIPKAAGCLRETYLKRVLDYYLEPSQMWYVVRGKLLHAILEHPGLDVVIQDGRDFVKNAIKRGDFKGSEQELYERWRDIEAAIRVFSTNFPSTSIPDWLTEVEYEYPLGVIDGEDWFLRGMPDVIRPAAGKLLDYKTIGDRGMAIIARGAKEDHELQVNAYRLMIERGYPVGQKDAYKPIKINEIILYYMTMMDVVGTGHILESTTPLQYKEPDIEPNEVSRFRLRSKELLVLKKGKRHETAEPHDYELRTKHQWRIQRLVPEVKLMDLDEVDAMIKTTAPILIRAFNKGEMPPMCSVEARAWKCDRYCPEQIREACDTYNERVGEDRLEGVDNGA